MMGPRGSKFAILIINVYIFMLFFFLVQLWDNLNSHDKLPFQRFFPVHFLHSDVNILRVFF